MKNIFQKLTSILVVVFFIILALGSVDDSSMSSNEPKQSEKIQDNENLTQAQKDSLVTIERQKEIEIREKQTISANELYYTYLQNEVSADNNFKGKTFYVEGVVDNIKKDLFGDIYVSLKTEDDFGRILCYLNDANVAAELIKGQRITVYGECDGLMLDVLMKNCIIVENLSDLKKINKKTCLTQVNETPE
ncbi:MAG: hypothetical protein WED10_12760 [Brumimicrobium sp.]